MPPAPLALLRSSHPGPAIAVSAITALLAIAAGLDATQVLLLTAAMFAGQVSVGLSNDAIDADRDRAVGRTDKPVAAGLVSRRTAFAVAIGSVIAAIALTIPLGWHAVLAHGVFIASAWAYNLGLKSTIASIVPYLVSFGLLPALVTLAAAEPHWPHPFAIAAGALLGAAAHVGNTLPDLDDDRATGVRGLPHRLGQRATGVVLCFAIAGAGCFLVIGAPSVLSVIGFGLSAALAAVCAALVLRGRSTRLLFRLTIVAALIDVVLLVVTADALLD